MVGCCAVATHAAGQETPTDPARRWALVIAARGGDDPHQAECLTYVRSTLHCLWRAGFDPRRVATFCESPQSAALHAAPVARAAVLDHLAQLKDQVRDGDELWVFLYGYANVNARGISYLTIGRRMRGPELVTALDAVPGRQIVLALHRQSAGLMEPLASERRVVVTATNDEKQLNWPKLTRRFVDVLAEDPSQSLLHVLREAARRTESYYRDRQFAPAETAQAHDGVAALVSPFDPVDPNDAADSVDAVEPIDASPLASIFLSPPAPQAQTDDGHDPAVDQADRDVRFVQFFGREPIGLVAEALQPRRVVVLAHDPRRAWQWHTMRSLVQSPDVARQIGVIYLPLSTFSQPLIDQMLNSGDGDPAP
ncbi:MAG: hypothetical protein CMJ49_02055 [Planctomycetaceae bacterium]|nr:hypothetical protein [Planctomycetaceae bacterium]